MFCPNCGAGAEPGGHYCKRCGGLLPGSRNRRFENAILVAPYLNLLCALLAAASFVSLLWAFPGDEGGWAVAVAGVSCFLIAVYQIVASVVSFGLRRRFVGARGATGAQELDGDSARRRALGEADASSFVGASGVTEHTTELLEALPRGREGARGDGR